MCTNIKKARKAAGFSQKEVALILKVSAPTVSDWESGNITPSAKNLKQLSSLYGVSTDYLLNLTGCPTPHNTLGSYIRRRRGSDSVDVFAEKCGVEPDVITSIEDGCPSEQTGGNITCKNSIHTEDLHSIATYLDVDYLYLACLHDRINPHRVRNVKIPQDDLTKSIPVLQDILLDLFGSNKKAPSVSDEAKLLSADEDHLIDLYRELNEEGQDKLVDYADDMVRSGKYIKSDEVVVGKEV